MVLIHFGDLSCCMVNLNTGITMGAVGLFGVYSASLTKQLAMNPDEVILLVP